MKFLQRGLRFRGLWVEDRSYPAGYSIVFLSCDVVSCGFVVSDDGHGIACADHALCHVHVHHGHRNAGNHRSSSLGEEGD